MVFIEIRDAGDASYPSPTWQAKIHALRKSHWKPSNPSKIGIRSLGPGAPATEYFPFYNMDFDVATSTEIFETVREKIPESITRLRSGKHDTKNGLSIYDLAAALQYGQGTGSTQMLKFLTEHIKVRAIVSMGKEGCP
jgi:hypothetical protein